MQALTRQAVTLARVHLLLRCLNALARSASPEAKHDVSTAGGVTCERVCGCDSHANSQRCQREQEAVTARVREHRRLTDVASRHYTQGLLSKTLLAWTLALRLIKEVHSTTHAPLWFCLGGQPPRLRDRGGGLRREG